MTKRDAEGVEGEMSGVGVYLLGDFPQRGLGRSPAANDFGHYIRNFVLFHACFSAFWNLTGNANKTDRIRPLLSAIGLGGGARAPCATHLDPPMSRHVSAWSDEV